MDDEDNEEEKKKREWEKNWDFYKSMAMLTDYTLRISIIGILIAGAMYYAVTSITSCTRKSELEQKVESSPTHYTDSYYHTSDSKLPTYAHNSDKQRYQHP